MKIPLYQVDAFTEKLFSGNPAAVCLLEDWPEDAVLQAIAAENNLSETAFVVAAGPAFELRWFTPRVEVALCGHATLAAAYVLLNCRGGHGDRVRFKTRRSGELTVKSEDNLLVMNFPVRSAKAGDKPEGLARALGLEPEGVFSSEEDLMVLVADEKTVREMAPDFAALAKISCRGVIVTAPGDTCDFVSRFFAPRVEVPEDPVTGSAHSVLIPYWSKILGKSELCARQVSARGGELYCRDLGDRVAIGGHAVLYLEGMLFMEAIGIGFGRAVKKAVESDDR